MNALIRFTFPCAIFLFANSPAVAGESIVEECHGTETVRMGDAAPTSLPYKLTFKADFSSNTYCYGTCIKDQTYPIADAKSSPLKLADLDKGGLIRHLTFDRASAKLTDYQVFNAGLGTVTRNATALCKPAKL